MNSFIGKVIDLKSIENADRILLATVDCGEDGGRWRGVVQRDSFSLNDKALVFLQDAIIPEFMRDDVPFMEGTNWRVKMRRFRGAPSECLIVHTSKEAIVGTCMDSSLGVEKYEKPIPDSGNIAGNFPVFIPKTDETFWQKNKRVLEYLSDVPVKASIKVDGSSCTVWRQGDYFGVASRRWEIEESDGSKFWRVVNKLGLRDILPDNFAVQMEIYGEGIQRNPLGIRGVDGVIFDLFTIDTRSFADAWLLADFCDTHGLPIAQTVLWNERLESIESDYLEYLANRKYPNGKPAEGIVIRAMEEHLLKGHRASLKVMNLNYKRH